MLRYSRLMKRKNSGPAGLYLHVPFCRSKCPYCAFYSIASSSLIPRWIRALKRECEISSGLPKESLFSFDSLHFGGGTPSLLECPDLAGIMECVRSCFVLSGNCEIAMEANPLDLKDGKAHFLKEMGFTRMVVGAQSFDDKALSFLGRNHSPADATGAVAALRRAGFENVGLDLIYGLEGQSLDSWIADLEAAVALSPEHISCYCLSIEEGTVFRRMADHGRLSTSSPEAERELFIEASRFLRERGYIHYEVSNFAKTLRHVSRHNLKYWRREPYLGLGPSAHSFYGEKRYWNKRPLKGYCETLEGGALPMEGSEDLTEEQAVLERIAMGLRIREGFRLDEETAPWIEHRGLERMEAGGLISVKGDMVAPTIEGFLVADRLPLEIMH